MAISPWLLSRLSDAVDEANLAIPQGDSIITRANQALAETGYGGKVVEESPHTIQPAIDHLENFGA
jgi:hypothetical protein